VVPQSTGMDYGNSLLRGLAASDRALLKPHLKAVPLKLWQRLQVSNRRIKTVYFPDTGLASVVAIGEGKRRQTDVGMIGFEGMVGLPIVHGADRSPCDVFMHVEGRGHCIDAESLRALLQQSRSMLGAFLRYAHVFGMQANDTALATAVARSKSGWRAGCSWPTIASTAMTCPLRTSSSR